MQLISTGRPPVRAHRLELVEARHQVVEIHRIGPGTGDVAARRKILQLEGAATPRPGCSVHSAPWRLPCRPSIRSWPARRSMVAPVSLPRRSGQACPAGRRSPRTAGRARAARGSGPVRRSKHPDHRAEDRPRRRSSSSAPQTREFDLAESRAAATDCRRPRAAGQRDPRGAPSVLSVSKSSGSSPGSSCSSLDSASSLGMGSAGVGNLRGHDGRAPDRLLAGVTPGEYQDRPHDQNVRWVSPSSGDRRPTCPLPAILEISGVVARIVHETLKP